MQRPRREFRLCRAALRVLLCRRLGCTNDALAFAAAEHGKPFALVDGAPAPVSFNVSHSGCHGLLAVADGGRIGVDVEDRVIRHDIDGVRRSQPRSRRIWRPPADAGKRNCCSGSGP